MLNLKLQDYNHRLGELLGDSLFSENKIAVYVQNHYIQHLRVTFIDMKGRVVYDNRRKDYKNLSNHLNRKEVAEAIKKGEL